MANSTVNSLDGLLSDLNQLKPPGASKTKISAITTLCVNNIQAEQAIVKSFYNALKKAPPTHKLGVLYVIDSVVRQWIEKAKIVGQDLNVEGRGEPGTFSAAIKRVTELLPTLFDDVLKGMPTEQKSKLENLVAIWERGPTFPAKVLSNLKAKFSTAPAQGSVPTNGVSAAQSSIPKQTGSKFAAPVITKPASTPVGYPPPTLYAQGFLPGRSQVTNTGHGLTPARSVQQAPPATSAPSQDVNSILAALSKIPSATQAPIYPPPTQAAPQISSMPNQLPPEIAALFGQQMAGQPAHVQPTPPTYGFPNPPQPPNPAFQPTPSYPGYPPHPPPSIPQVYPAVRPPPQQQLPQQQQQQADPLAPLRGLLPANILNDNQKLIPALKLLQDLQKEGYPPDQWAPVLKAFEEQYQTTASTGYAGQQNYNQPKKRSRSPERGGGGRGGRGSPVYGAYDGNSLRNQGEAAGRGADAAMHARYRQRSPIRDSPAPLAMNGKPMQPKYIAFDSALPPNHIKVLSRTLFVGGANGSQQEIQDLFERFGSVQTCIANRDKRHAFVKMTTREFALVAKGGMEEMQTRNDREIMNIARQTKWGVGFGPRECCDYAKGESIIPIHKLTEADMKWLLTAEFGGTGGKQVEGGMVLEEPDIEIGAGVSSKAMSKRVGPDHTPQQAKKQKEDRGGRHNKHKGGDHGFGGGYSGVTGGPPAMEPYGYARPEPVAVATPPAVPGFGFSLGLPPTNPPGNYR